MQFQAKNPISEPVSEAIMLGMRALDGLAEIRVDASVQQIYINSQLPVPQIIEVLGKAGCDASIAESFESSHKQGGSTCCGGCS